MKLKIGAFHDKQMWIYILFVLFMQTVVTD